METSIFHMGNVVTRAEERMRLPIAVGPKAVPGLLTDVDLHRI